MSNKLQLFKADILTQEEKTELGKNIDSLIDSHKQNRQAINRLVFESVAAMTEADSAATELSRKGTLSRWIGGITGSNQKLQNEINKNRSVAQYAAQQTLQKLAEQNLLTVDLVAAVNNKLNASLNNVDKEFVKIYDALVKFFRHNRVELEKFKDRLEKVEQDVDLLRWQNTIEDQEFEGKEYTDLDNISKIVCLTRDFYEITKGKWTTADLLLLKSAMRTIEVKPKEKVNYLDSIKEIAYNDALKDKLLGGVEIQRIEEPGYLVSMSALMKLEACRTEEKSTVDTISDFLKENRVTIDKDKICEALTKKYLANEAYVDINKDIECYDFVLDLLYNLKQINTEEIKAEIIQNKVLPQKDSIITGNKNYDETDIMRDNSFSKAADAAVDECCKVAMDIYETREPSNETSQIIENMTLDSLSIQRDETKTFNHKNIVINKSIKCRGTLIFNHCEIACCGLNDDDMRPYSDERIVLIENAKLIFRECIFKGDKPLIVNGDGKIYKPTIEIEKCIFCEESFGLRGHDNRYSTITLKDSRFIDCNSLIENVKLDGGEGLKITGCTLEMNKRVPGSAIISVSQGYAEITNSKIIAPQYKLMDISPTHQLENGTFIFDGLQHVSNCEFKYVFNIFNDVEIVRKCIFEDCTGTISVFGNVNGTVIENCEFLNCRRVLRCGMQIRELIKIRNCSFKGNWKYERAGLLHFPLLTFNGTCQIIEECTFEDMDLNNEGGRAIIWLSNLKRNVDQLVLKDCNFKKIRVLEKSNGPITVGLLSCDSLPYKADDFNYVQFERCKFENCSGQLVNCWVKYNESGWFGSSGKIRAVSFKGCNGIDNEGFCKLN